MGKHQRGESGEFYSAESSEGVPIETKKGESCKECPTQKGETRRQEPAISVEKKEKPK